MEDDAILQCAAYLAEIIGDYDRHIYMAGKLDQKYSMAPRRATVKDMLKHLSGTRPCGGLLHHADDSTKALCFDGDYPSDLALLESAAMALSEAGYSPIIEYSPARGGHLWILFDERVQRLAAYHHVYQIAPSLAQIREAWPRGNYSGNNLRILGSRYIRTTTGDDGQPVAINAWCKLVSVADGEALHGEQRIPGQTAHFLLSHMTPASIVPAYEALPEPEQPAKRGAGGGAVNSSHSGLVELAENELDEQWKEKYSRAKFPVAFTPEQLSAWYNQTHDIRAMLPYDERTRKYYASYRDETEASVSIYDDDTFCDFGLQSPDGGYYTGNAIELLSLSKYGGNKQRCMQDVGRELRQKAIQAIENAALSGLALPSWVESIITDDGRALYERLSHREAQDSQAQPEHQAQQGGVNSYHQPGTLRPDLQSLYASQGWYHADSSDTLIMQGLKWAFSGQPAREQLVSYWAQFTSLQKALKHNVSIPGLFTREKTGQMYQLNASGVFRVLKDAYSMKPSPERQQRLDEIRRAIAHK